MDSEKSSVTLKIGWILLLLAGLLMTLGGLESFAVAYWGADDLIAGVSLEKLAQVNPDLPKAIRGRRATAAFYATSCGLLVAWVAVSAFRRRQKWAWYALLCSLGVGALCSFLRVSLLDYTPGSQAALAIAITLVLALAVSYRDFR